MIFYHVVLYIALIIASVVGTAITVVNLPGLWLILGSLGVYELLTWYRYASWRTLLAMFIAAAVAEYLEITSSGRAARRAGASRRGIWGAIIGGIVGGIALTGLIPIPVVGTIIGLLAGTFVGAIVGEFTGGAEVGTSLKVGAVAAKGRFIGLLIKLTFGVGMLITVAITAFPRGPAATRAIPAAVTTHP